MTKLKAGDKVNIRLDLTLKEIRENCFNGCQIDTMDFLKHASFKDFSEQYILDEVKNEYVSIYINGKKLLVNTKVFERPVNKLVTSLDDLQFADILTLRNGERYVYASGYMCGEDSDYVNDCDEIKEYYRDDLQYDSENRDYKKYDIVKIERKGQIIYERVDVREMTVEEISNALGYEVKVVK